MDKTFEIPKGLCKDRQTGKGGREKRRRRKEEGSRQKAARRMEGAWGTLLVHHC